MRRVGAFQILVAWFCAVAVQGQNVVEKSPTARTVAPLSVSIDQAGAVFDRQPAVHLTVPVLQRKLNAHVAEFLEGHPWMPFQHTLGISGHETYFDHPDEMFYALSLAAPLLDRGLFDQVRAFLKSELGESAPYAAEGFDKRSGRARENYTVPSNVRLSGRGRSLSAFGVYAFWRYCDAFADFESARVHWPRVRLSSEALIGAPYPFDPEKPARGMDSAEKLNGDLAGLIGLVHLARLCEDRETEASARKKGVALLSLRINLDRMNPAILQPTRSATKQLHAHKLDRFCDLTPEIGAALARWTEGCAAGHLERFRRERNTWHLAAGDRLIGGENYTNPLHLSRALFAGAALVEQAPPAELARWIDVPWCPGDFYFIEKCALALGTR